MTKITSILAFAAFLQTVATATTIDFTSSQGYSDGTITGQDGWAYIFGTQPSGLWAATDSAGSGGIAHVAGATGAIRRDFTETEIGGSGYTFDDTSSVITFASEFTMSGSAKTDAATWAPNLAFWWGSYFGTQDFTITIRPDGIMEADGNGAIARSASIFSPGNTYTFSVTADYGSDTFTITSTGDGAQTFSHTDSFNSGSDQLLQMRLSGGFTEGDTVTGTNTDPAITQVTNTIGINSITVDAVPEPSAYALLAGLLTLGFVAVRRRR